jgi:hypothetical protein
MARSTVSGGGNSNDSNSLHSYHLWLKEKQKEEEEKKNNLPAAPPKSGTPTSSVKEEDEDNEDDNQEENFQVDAIMERGPSPPENNESSNSYEWSYEEQFKQVRNRN